jgi:bifunctional non-homologous end joining protein LigD
MAARHEQIIAPSGLRGRDRAEMILRMPPSAGAGSGKAGGVSPKEERVTVVVDDRELSLSNLAKPMYPDTGFTKGELIDYYAKIAPVMLPYLRGRPVTTKRFPNGVAAPSFIEKNVPRHAPEWVRTVVLDRKSKGADTNNYAVIDDLATLVWFANLASIEFHTPMWRIDASGLPQPPDLIVFDLDPGEPATIVQCCEVALVLRHRLSEDGIALVAKTSGSKGLQLYGATASHGFAGKDVNTYAHEVAEAVEADEPELVVSRMTKALRAGKILIDWSQNNPAKTTVTPYSMRALPHPSVSTPVTWDEVEGCARGGRTAPLGFGPEEVLQRVGSCGDLFATVLA